MFDQRQESTDLLEKCVRQRRQNNCGMIDGKQNEDNFELTVVSNSNEIARTLKIYFKIVTEATKLS